ncbi:MAG TPA: hypothetical protein VJQ55_13645 [Candidatus Binatia bacterium]|nr:hypothetical protein [Candidatus Binatia bacterium]
MSLKNFLLPAFFISAVLFGSSVGSEELKVYFKTTPRSELLRPFIDATELSLLVTGSDGRPLEQGTVAIRLEAPRSARFFSTDYPLVEGTVLSELRLPLRQGRAAWKQLLPIRGVYRLTVDVSGEGETKAKQMFSFNVRESGKKWLVLAAFSAGLFVLGFAAGRVFTSRGTAVGAVALILSMAPSGVSSGEKQPDGSALLEVEPPTVGKLSEVRWRAPTSGSGATTLSLTISNLEKQKVVFAVEKVPVDGAWTMRFHFPDAGEYRVSAVANLAGRGPVRSEYGLSVAGVEPPARTMIGAMAFFVGLIALGLGLGRWSKLRRKSV